MSRIIRYFLIFLIFLLPSICPAATEVVKVVDPDNGTGTDYTSLSAWEAGEQRNLPNMQRANTSNHNGTFTSGETLSFSPSGATGVMIETDNSSYMRYELSSGTPTVDDTISGDSSGASCDIDTFAYQDGEIAVAKCRCSSGSADTTAVTIDGWEPSEACYIKIQVDPDYRHNGKWNESKYRLEVSTSANVIVIAEDYVQLHGIQISNDYNGDGKGVRIEDATTGEVQISHCIIRATNTTGNSKEGIQSVADNDIKVWNTIIYDFYNDGSSKGLILAYNMSATAYVYNVTIYNCNYGLRNNSGTGGTILAKNVLVQNCGDGFYGSFHSDSDYNISDISGDAPGANSKTCTVSFVDEANDDFHLASSDTCAKDAGTDLSSDTYYAFNDDIDGETRSGTWDIGADEYVAAVEAPKRVQAIIISKKQKKQLSNIGKDESI